MDPLRGDDVVVVPPYFAPPALPTHAAVLERVVAMLESGPGRLVVVAAPAGYGKTTHVAAWARSTHLPLAWVDLEVVHDDPVRLLAVLVDALRGVTDLDAAAISSTGRGFSQAVRACTQPFALVLDDVHHVRRTASIDLLDRLVANVPEGSRVVVAGRVVRLPALAKLRAGVGVTEVRLADLALGPGEATALLSGMGVGIEPAGLAQLLADTEGWPVGIRLAGLAHLDAAAPAPLHVRGADATVSEYVWSEWLLGLDPEEETFLSLVSALDWLTGPVCDDVLGTSGSGAVLERLFENRLLVVPLDRRHERYRLHPLLREVLQADLLRTRPDEHRRVHLRASAWYERQGDGDRAIDHALLGGDVDRAEDLVVRHTAEFQMRGMVATTERWVASFAPERLRASPGLSLVAAVTTLGHDNDAALAWLALCRRLLQQSGRLDAGDGLAMCFLAFEGVVWSGAVAPALASTARARDALPPGVWHALACEAHGAHAFAAGLDHVAVTVLEEGAQEARLFDAPQVELHCDAHLARVLHHGGDTDRAIRLALSVRDRLRRSELEHAPTTLLISATTAWAAAFSGDPDGAREDMARCRASLEAMTGTSTWRVVQACLAAAEASLLLGDRGSAVAFLKQADTALAAQPDAVRPREQLVDMTRRVEAAHQWLPVGLLSLSVAELRVLHFLPTNLTLGEIGERLFVSRHTTKSHVGSIYRKLGTSSRSETVEVGRAIGLLPMSTSSSTD